MTAIKVYQIVDRKRDSTPIMLMVRICKQLPTKKDEENEHLQEDGDKL